MQKFEVEKEAWRKSRRRNKSEEPTPPSPRMVRGEETNFLLFAQALKILVGSSIRIDQVPNARKLLQRYLLEFSSVDNMRARSDLPTLERDFLQELNDDVREAFGTIQDAVRDERSSTRVEAGDIAQTSEKLDDVLKKALELYYNKAQPQVHQELDDNPPPNTSSLNIRATTYHYALLDGRRITPTSMSKRKSAGSAIIQARIHNKRYAGVVQTILMHKQDGVLENTNTLLCAVNWMKPSKFTPLDNPEFVWDDYPELGVETWELDQYVDPLRSEPLMIIPLAEIHCQLCRDRITHVDPPLWITATMDRRTQ
ncbi:hypothetical protein K438DRAFT_2138267 [Mycena galopus ATCC 62051]|nr:hypothetical protein K438DRAFT_2138267 [Mycena galopus ATCC 62051]